MKVEGLIEYMMFEMVVGHSKEHGSIQGSKFRDI